MVVLVLVLTFVLLFVLGIPIAFCLGISTLATMLMTMDFTPAVTTISQRMAGGVNSFALLAIPFQGADRFGARWAGFRQRDLLCPVRGDFRFCSGGHIGDRGLHDP